MAWGQCSVWGVRVKLRYGISGTSAHGRCCIMLKATLNHIKPQHIVQCHGEEMGPSHCTGKTSSDTEELKMLVKHGFNIFWSTFGYNARYKNCSYDKTVETIKYQLNDNAKSFHSYIHFERSATCLSPTSLR